MRTPLAVAALFAVLPGCVVQEMHDDLRATRNGVDRLAALTPELKRTNDELARTNVQLEEMLTHMRSVDRQLQRLDSMERSLARLDEHLAALRKIIENIDRVTPGKLTKDTPSATMPAEPQR